MLLNPQVLRRPRVVVETMGCKLNLADSELLSKRFVAAGYLVLEQDQAAADVYVLNTCTVTHVADRKARQILRAARKRNPQALIVAAGCYPERAQDELAKMGGIDLVIGNAGKDTLVDLISERLEERTPLDPDSILPARAAFLPNQTRSFVKIQEGCNDYCSYCIIPKTRGRSRFFDADGIVAEVLERERAGFPEVVLTGTQLGDYGIEGAGSRRRGPDGRDQGSQGDPLAALLQAVLQRTRVPRLRLSSLQPQDITEPLLALWQDRRLCPHLHLPLQSGSDNVLRRMRRRYSRQEYAQAVGRIRASVPGVSITTDVIAGFPGEAEEDFEETLAFCETLGFSDIHVFPYSIRAGTLAARFGDAVPEPARKERVRRLLALAEQTHRRHRERFVATRRPVLWEEQKAVRGVTGGPVWSGLTDNYLRVYCHSSDRLAGRMTDTEIADIRGGELWGLVQP